MWKDTFRKFLLEHEILEQFCDALLDAKCSNTNEERVQNIVNCIDWEESRGFYPTNKSWSKYDDLWRIKSSSLKERRDEISLSPEEKRALSMELRHGTITQRLYKHLKAIQKEF